MSELGFEKDKQRALLSLIDKKINNDMKEVISEIKRLEDKSDSRFAAMDSKISMIMWALGILMAVIIALKFIH